MTHTSKTKGSASQADRRHRTVKSEEKYHFSYDCFSQVAEEEKPKPVDESESDLVRALWLSVLVQASVDARNKSESKSRRADREQATSWLDHGMWNDHGDFAMVCDLAGIDLREGRRIIARLLNCPEGMLDFRKLRKGSKDSRGL